MFFTEHQLRITAAVRSMNRSEDEATLLKFLVSKLLQIRRESDETPEGLPPSSCVPPPLSGVPGQVIVVEVQAEGVLSSRPSESFFVISLVSDSLRIVVDLSCRLVSGV